MLEIKVCLSNIDFDQLEILLAPQMSRALEGKLGFIGKALGNSELVKKMEHLYLQRKTNEEKEALLAKLVNENSQLLSVKLKELSAEHGLDISIEELQINKI